MVAEKYYIALTIPEEYHCVEVGVGGDRGYTYTAYNTVVGKFEPFYRTPWKVLETGHEPLCTYIHSCSCLLSNVCTTGFCVCNFEEKQSAKNFNF